MYINLNLNENESKYVNASLDDNTQDIYREYISNTSSIIRCKLPKGGYNLVFRSPKDAQKAYADFRMKGLKAFRNDNRVLITLDNPTQISLNVSGGGSKYLIELLRKQVIHNNRLYGDERLIAKDIKSRSTDLGEDYNRESFESTIIDYFNDDENLVVDLTKSPKDSDVKYLQLMKLMQDKNRYEIKQQKLDMEAMELAIREQKLMRY
jgi:hypothetical protein